MPIFFYSAKSIEGEIKTDVTEAASIKELAQRLRIEGLFLCKAETKNEKETKNNFDLTLLNKKVPLSEKMLMTRNLWIMVATGLPLVKSFSVLSEQAQNKRMKKALFDISREIGKGSSLHLALDKYPDIFSELYRSMIQVGEEAGTLEDSLNTLSLQLEKEKEMRSKIKNALIYPIILVIVMFIVAICLSIFVLPKLNTFFKGMNASLPITTKIILGMGDFFLNYWHVAITTILLALISFFSFGKSKSGKIIIDKIVLKIPGISDLVKKSNSASLIRSLSSLLSSGVPLIKSLEITAGTVNNYYFKQALASASREVERGSQLHIALQINKEIFPFGVTEMIEIGEETGRTSMILKKLAEFYEQEVAEIAEGLSTIIEPILIVVIGLAVGIFAVSIISPLYSSLNNL